MSLFSRPKSCLRQKTINLITNYKIQFIMVKLQKQTGEFVKLYGCTLIDGKIISPVGGYDGNESASGDNLGQDNDSSTDSHKPKVHGYRHSRQYLKRFERRFGRKLR